jgi:hypothetical protein
MTNYRFKKGNVFKPEEQTLELQKGCIYVAKDRRDQSIFSALIEIRIVEVKGRVVKIKRWILGETYEVWMLREDLVNQYQIIEKIGEDKK